jgi:hypothetical protein
MIEMRPFTIEYVLPGWRDYQPILISLGRYNSGRKDDWFVTRRGLAEVITNRMSLVPGLSVTKI